MKAIVAAAAPIRKVSIAELALLLFTISPLIAPITRKDTPVRIIE